MPHQGQLKNPIRAADPALSVIRIRVEGIEHQQVIFLAIYMLPTHLKFI